MKEHANWIDGEPRLTAHSFELPDPARIGESLGRWSRSGPEELALALDAAARARSRPADPRRRARALAQAIRAVALDPDPEGLVARSIGLEPGELEPHVRGLERRLERALAQPATAGTGPVLVRRHWSELFYGLGETLVRELAAGRAVVLLSDPAVPGLAERFARAFIEAGLAPGALALLHDDGETALRAACAGGCFERISASGHGDFRTRLEAYCRGSGAGPGPTYFGAGVIEAPATELAFTPLERGVAWVEASDDPCRRGREVARAAFGRVAALSGQRSGRLGLVTCHPRVFARFTEALLEVLEGDEAAFAPLPLLDPSAFRELEDGLQLGLDEGATLIHELAPTASCPPRPHARVGRLVFTNVDPESRLAALTRPIPLLALVRGHGGGLGGFASGAR